MTTFLLSIVSSVLSGGVNFATKMGLDKLFKPEQIKLQEKLNQHFSNLESELRNISGLLEEAQKTNPEAKKILERVKQTVTNENFEMENLENVKFNAGIKNSKSNPDSDQEVGNKGIEMNGVNGGEINFGIEN